MLQSFEQVALAMVEAAIAIQHASGNLSRLRVMVAGSSLAVPLTAVPPPAPAAAQFPVVVGGQLQKVVSKEGTVEVRLPYTPQLLEVMDSYFTRNVPGELWLSPAARWLEKGRDPALRSVLTGLVADLTVQASTGYPDGENAILRWLWLLEDILLATRLLAGPEARASPGAIPALKLPIPEGLTAERIEADLRSVGESWRASQPGATGRLTVPSAGFEDEDLGREGMMQRVVIG